MGMNSNDQQRGGREGIIANAAMAPAPGESPAAQLTDSSSEEVDDRFPPAVGTSGRAAARLVDSIRDADERLAQCPGGHTVIGGSEVMASVLQRAVKYARSQAPVLLVGESGTGKEVLAEFIHHASPRAEMPFIAVNCAALPDTLMESELFGHERGAFTGATARRIGRFESAEGGTLLLDEISEMPVALQAKLLRVLESLQFQRIGSNEVIGADVRIIATSNRDLESEVRRGSFRLDLFYRLNVLPLPLPPLRDRRQDIPALTHHFLRQFQASGETVVRAIDPSAMQMLIDHVWPGNVRELRNVLHQVCVLAADSVMQVHHLSALRNDRHASPLQPIDSGFSLHSAATPTCYAEGRRNGASDIVAAAGSESVNDSPTLLPSTAAGEGHALRDAERELVLATLKRCGGNKAAAARELGVTSRTMYNKMKKYRAQGLL